MSMSFRQDPQYKDGGVSFPPTLWSRVRLAVAQNEPGADRALEELCSQYQRPIFIFILRKGYPPQEAEDLKQGFFEHLLSRNSFADVASLKIKLRAFLITKLQSFLIDHHRSSIAAKRGAGRVAAMADLSETQALLAEPVDDQTPLLAFQRQWMETIATNALENLRQDYAGRGLERLFTALAPFITGNAEQSLAELSAHLGRPEGTLKSDISRLRSRCQSLIREQVAATLDHPTPEAVTAELRELMGS